MPRPIARLSIIAGFVAVETAGAQGTRLLRHPTISRESIAFQYAGDLWVTARAGGAARRLTATPDVETDPRFSPDGSLIAFSRTSGNNTDIYVVPAAGGEPRRLTYHPGSDRVRGWAPDGKRIFFASDRASPPQSSYLRLWSVPVDGGFEEPLPMPRAFGGQFSPDGKRIAYEEIPIGVRARLVRDERLAPLSRRPHAAGADHGCREPLRREAAVEGQQ